MKKLIPAAVAAMLCLLTGAPLAAQEVTDSARLAELERQMEVLTRELERMRLGRDVVEADTSILGLGPAASKVYKVDQGVSLGGYGEFLYENFSDEREDGSPSGATDRFDALRAIIYVGYKFSDRILFNSEIEIEHADEIFLEFAYLDYLLNDNVGLRAGMLLSPMGFVNELHEPPIFLGTERPVTESVIIPTTWRENGAGLFGGNEAVSWRAYVLNGLDGAGFGPAGLRGGRQKGSKALAEDFGVVGRVDYTGTLGLVLGGSAYFGQSDQNREVGGAEVDGGTLIWEGHAEYKASGFDLRALVAGASVDDVEGMNAIAGLGAGQTIGESMLGWYLQGGYDVLRGVDTRHQLVPYVRFEKVDTQDEVPSGFTRDLSQERTIVSLGAQWKPLPNAVWKMDYQIHSTEADTGVDQLNIALGWLF